MTFIQMMGSSLSQLLIVSRVTGRTVCFEPTLQPCRVIFDKQDSPPPPPPLPPAAAASAHTMATCGEQGEGDGALLLLCLVRTPADDAKRA